MYLSRGILEENHFDAKSNINVPESSFREMKFLDMKLI